MKELSIILNYFNTGFGDGDCDGDGDGDGDCDGGGDGGDDDYSCILWSLCSNC